MHDRLFEHQDTLDDEGLKQYATELDLDTDRFIQELSDHTYASRVREDFLSGARSGVNGAPHSSLMAYVTTVLGIVKASRPLSERPYDRENRD